MNVPLCSVIYFVAYANYPVGLSDVAGACRYAELLHRPKVLIRESSIPLSCSGGCHSNSEAVPRKMGYRIAGNFRWVQIFAIFADRPASVKIKTAKKNELRWKLITSLRAYVEYPCERDGSLSLSAL